MWAVLEGGTPVGNSPRAGQGTEGPVDRGNGAKMVTLKWCCGTGTSAQRTCSKTGRSMPASINRESVTTEMKKKVRIKCAA